MNAEMLRMLDRAGRASVGEGAPIEHFQTLDLALEQLEDSLLL